MCIPPIFCKFYVKSTVFLQIILLYTFHFLYLSNKTENNKNYGKEKSINNKQPFRL